MKILIIMNEGEWWFDDRHENLWTRGYTRDAGIKYETVLLKCGWM